MGAITNRRVAFLRGINVGTAKRIAMADLRTLFEDLGHTDVRTLLNSGNVVFTAGKTTASDEGARLEAAIAKGLGVTTRVTVLTGKALAAAVRDNPIQPVAMDPSRMLLMVLKDEKAAAQLKPLLKESWTPEMVSISSRVAYLWCPDGIAKSKLWATANRLAGDAGTARNLATMAKLLVLVKEA